MILCTPYDSEKATPAERARWSVLAILSDILRVEARENGDPKIMRQAEIVAVMARKKEK